jgi:virulence factor Mce-like protein
MANSFDAEGRGPSDGRLLVLGLIFVVIVAVTCVLMIAKSRGALDPFVRVSATLVNVGDGLPAKSDVKFRGVLVGYVAGVVPTQGGRPNVVSLNLKPQYASGIPNTVTARVVPSNVFAVSSVQLVDNGKAAPALREGSVIPEDQTLPTVLLQTSLNKFRQLLAAIGREPNPDSIGWLTALGQATEGRGDRLQNAAHDLNEIVTQLNTVVTDQPGPSTISALADAAAGLRDSAPELLDALDGAVRPMRTLAEKRVALMNFLSAATGTVSKLGDAFDNQADRLINMTTQLTAVVGTLADDAEGPHILLTNGQEFSQKIMNEGFDWNTNRVRAKAVVLFHPTRTYVRADCPRYGDLLGPSCFTAPEVPTAPALEPSLNSMGFPMPPGVTENRPNYAPPRGSVLPPEAYEPLPGDAPPASPPPPAATPPPGMEPLLPAEAPPGGAPNAAPASVMPQSAVIGGNVGPVGSDQEKAQLNHLMGGRANTVTEVMFAPLLRGTTVSLTTPEGQP